MTATRVTAAAQWAPYRSKADTALLRAAADRMHLRILKSISGLTNEEADLIEPAFTEFETYLLRLRVEPE